VSVAAAAVAAGRFADQAVIVTGGSRGIGRAVALAFAAEGADVVLNYAGNHAAAGEVAEGIAACGRRAVLVSGSVADPKTAERLARTAAESFGRIDVLVNNAGINRDGYLMMLRDEAWQEVLGVNLHGTFYCCRAVLETMMRQRRGAIVNMTSTAGLKGRAGQVNYAATKGAVIALTKTLAQEMGPHGVRVNAVAPGFIETDMVGGLLSRPEVRQEFLEATPAGRFGAAEDVAGAVLYLASTESSYVSGHVLLVNGGLFV
jgi:3-oxoacyl-[acyl-carrier protein] reductase